MPNLKTDCLTLLRSFVWKEHESGTAAVEFAFCATILMAMLTPVIDLGMAFYQQMQVQTAANAGADYAMVHGWNSTAISDAVTGATPLSISVNPAPAESCGCPNGTAITAATCSSLCANGHVAGTYVTVSAQATYVPVVPYSILGSSTTLQGSATVRIQ